MEDDYQVKCEHCTLFFAFTWVCCFLNALFFLFVRVSSEKKVNFTFYLRRNILKFFSLTLSIFRRESKKGASEWEREREEIFRIYLKMKEKMVCVCVYFVRDTISHCFASIWLLYSIKIGRLNEIISSDFILLYAELFFFSVEFIRLNELWLFQLFDFVCIFFCLHLLLSFKNCSRSLLFLFISHAPVNFVAESRQFKVFNKIVWEAHT